jgi:pimeloyl-ACP methyl ester carboxylesterase
MKKPAISYPGMALALAALLLGGVACSGQAAPTSSRPQPSYNPIIFVHGFTGSGAQFESQQLRFVENGYPQDYVGVFEYDSTFGLAPQAQVMTNLDAYLAKVRAETRRPQLDLAGHSLGTAVLQGYLRSSTARASAVGHYVNIDGQTATSLPGGVATLAIWAGRGAPGRSIAGATNVTVPDQTHVQSATSAETFAAMFRFLTGRDPQTTNVEPEASAQITIAGRVLNFPQNIGFPGATLQIWEVAPATGQHATRTPLKSLVLPADGSWGPLLIMRGKHYEFVLLRQEASTQHFFLEPFRRSDHLVRLLAAPAAGGLDTLVDKSSDHVALVISRNKELWGDEGAPKDVLAVNGTNIVNSATAPISHRTNAIFVFDQGSDHNSNVTVALPAFFALPFLSGVDLYVPAASPPRGVVSVALTSRGGGPVRTVNFPNFPSTTDGVSVDLFDYDQ